MLLDVFAEHLRRRGRPTADFSLLDVEPTEMLLLLAASWGLNPEPSMNTASLWRTLTDRLIEYRYQRLEPVVLLDDADQANPEVQRHIARLARFDTSPDARLSIVLAGRNEGIARLDQSLASLTDLRIEGRALAANGNGAIRQQPLEQSGPPHAGVHPHRRSIGCKKSRTAYPAALPR